MLMGVLKMEWETLSVAGGVKLRKSSSDVAKNWSFGKKLWRGQTIVGRLSGQKRVHSMVCI